MTIDEAIKREEEVTDEKMKEACNLYEARKYEESRECIWCAEEHRQLAEWMKELKSLSERYRSSDTKNVENLKEGGMTIDVDTSKPNVIYFRFKKDETPDQMAKIIGKELLLNYAYVQSSFSIDAGKMETLVAFDIRRLRV